MGISDTIKKWQKDANKSKHFMDTPAERWAGRKARPAKKEFDKKRKFAAKMKKGGYPGRFISEKEQETN